MGTIIPFVPLAKAFKKYLPKIADRPYSKVEAAFCLMVDYDDHNEVTVSGYAKLWQWNKKTVSKFIIDHGAEIVYPKNTGNYKNQRGLISILKRDISLPLKGTNKGLIAFIDNRDLDSNRDLKGTNKGLMTTHKRDKSLVTTIEPKPKPEPKITNGFDLFWSAYPKKKSKGAAEKAYQKIKPDANLLESILESIRDQLNSEDWIKEGGQFIPYPATWLNAKAWEDETVSIASIGAEKQHKRNVEQAAKLNEGY